MSKKISYKDLDGWLKFLVVINWISVGGLGISFLAGIVIGLAGY